MPANKLSVKTLPLVVRGCLYTQASNLVSSDTSGSWVVSSSTGTPRKLPKSTTASDNSQSD